MAVSIMPCLDVQNGRVVKGVQFEDIRDAGDPVECCLAYCRAGADELALLDISATIEGRPTMLEVVGQVAREATAPFTVGGGINGLASARQVLEAGADKVAASSAAFRDPAVIEEMAAELGHDRVTVAIDAGTNSSLPSGYEVYVDGGRTPTGRDAIEWARIVDRLGVKTILPTSKATDGVKTGYDLELIRGIKSEVGAEVVASGGAGSMEHFHQAVQAGAEILLAASIFHYQIISIPELKVFLKNRDIEVQ